MITSQEINGKLDLFFFWSYMIYDDYFFISTSMKNNCIRVEDILN